MTNKHNKNDTEKMGPEEKIDLDKNDYPLDEKINQDKEFGAIIGQNKEAKDAKTTGKEMVHDQERTEKINRMPKATNKDTVNKVPATGIDKTDDSKSDTKEEQKDVITKPDNKSSNLDNKGDPSTDAEQKRLMSQATGSVIQDIVQDTIRNQRATSDDDDISMNDISFNLDGKTYDLKYSGFRPIVKAPPQILQIITNKTHVAETLDIFWSKGYQFLEKLPCIQQSRDTFRSGTDVVRVIIDTVNTTTKVTHDPAKIVSSNYSFFKNVHFAEGGDTTEPWKTDSSINIQKISYAIFKHMIPLIKSCRVIYEPPAILRPLVNAFGIDRVDIQDAIINKLATVKLHENYGKHLILGAIDHDTRWFSDDVKRMYMTEPDEYIFGEYLIMSTMMGGRKREVEMIEATDQYAAALINIDYTRRRENRMKIREYKRQLYVHSFPGTLITIPPMHKDSDYECDDISKQDVESYLFIYHASKSFQNSMIERAIEGAISLKIVESVTLSNSISILRGVDSSQARENMSAEFQSKLKTVSAELFIRLIAYDLLGNYIPVRYEPLSSIHHEFASIPTLWSNLVCIALFPNIFAQNKHIIAYNICSILYSLHNKHYLDFQSLSGFAPNMKLPKIIDDVDYKKGVIPYMFDVNLKTSNKLIMMIRELMVVDGESHSPAFNTEPHSPKLSSEKSVYLPYQYIRREIGNEITPLAAKITKIVDILKLVGSQYQKTVLERKVNISDFNKLVLALEPLVREFGMMMHFEGTYIYKYLINHYGIPYCDINSADDYNKTNKLRIGTITDSDLSHTHLPWVIEREAIYLPTNLMASCIFTIAGIYSEYTWEYKQTDRNIQAPDPVKEFKQYYVTVKAAAQATEPLAIARYMISNGQSKFIQEFKQFAERAGMRSAFKELFREIVAYFNEVPDDICQYVNDRLEYINDLRTWDPKLVFVDDDGNIITRLAEKPIMIEKTLKFGDNFLQAEIDVVSDLLFDYSFLFHITTGITIMMQSVDYYSPRNMLKPFPDVKGCTANVYRVELIQQNNTILVPKMVNGKPMLILRLMNTMTNKVEEFIDLSANACPYVHYTADHPNQIDPIYRADILKLVKMGRLAFTFRKFWYQAKIDYATIRPDYPDTQLDIIFSTYNNDVPQIIFPDNRKDATSMSLGVRPQQYIWTSANIETDILMRDITGMRKDIRAYQPPDPEHWTLGKRGRSMCPLTSGGKPKTKLAKPNFLNTIPARYPNTFRDGFPPVKISRPQSMFASWNSG